MTFGSGFQHDTTRRRRLVLCPGDKLPAGWASVEFDPAKCAKWTDTNTPASSQTGNILLLRKAFTLNNAKFAQLRLRFLGGKSQVAKVYINGTLVVQATNGDAKRYLPIAIPAKAQCLLTKGPNILAVALQSEGKAKIDLALEALAR